MESLPPIQIDTGTFLKQHYTLPPLSRIVTHLQNMLQDDNAPIQEVAKVISSDPAMVAQILKIANSAYYGLPREVVEVKFAIAFLGLYEVFRIVLSLSVINTLSVKNQEELQNYWFHSFYSALCSKYVAKKYFNKLSFEEIASAAILHDIGKLVYIKFFPAHYEAMIGYKNEKECLFIQAEEHFGLPSSSYFGTLLCDHWKLPKSIRIACETHSFSDLPKIDGKPYEDLRYVITLGNIMVILATERLTEKIKQSIADAIKSSLRCSEESFLAIMGDVYELKMEAERFVHQFR